jgi:hypothetical protein
MREPGLWAFALEWVDAGGPFGDALARAIPAARGRSVTVDRFERASLERRPTLDYLNRTVSPRHRKELRRARRQLQEEVGPLHVCERAADRLAPARFLELERAGWKGRAGTAMACDSGHASFFVELCHRWAAAGRLQLLALEGDARTVAMKCNLRAGAGIFCFKIAFDEELARFSPGVQLEVSNIETFQGTPAAWMDSCAAPDNSMINRLWERRRSLQTLIVCPQGARGALGRGLWRGACAGRDIRQRLEGRANVAAAQS